MGMFRALRHRSFRFLWASSLALQVAYWFSTVSFQTIVPHDSDGDALLLGVLFFCTLAPYILFSLPAGALADTWDRRSLLLAAQFFALGLSVVGVLLAALDALPTPVLLMLAFAWGCSVTFASPANQSLTSATVPPHDLASAIPLQSTSLNLGRMLGPTAAGPVLLLGGPVAAFAASGLISVVALLSTRAITARSTGSATASESVVRRISAGIRHARERRPTMVVLGLVAGTSIFACAFQAQVPLLASRVASAEDVDTAFVTLLAFGGLGALFGVLGVAGLSRLPSVRSLAVQLVATGAAVASMGLVGQYWMMALAMVLACAGIFSIMASANTLIQHLIDDGQRGRVMSLYMLCWGGVLPFGGLGIGALISATGTPTAFLVYGGIAAAIGVAAALPTWPGPAAHPLT